MRDYDEQNSVRISCLFCRKKSVVCPKRSAVYVSQSDILREAPQHLGKEGRVINMINNILFVQLARAQNVNSNMKYELSILPLINVFFYARASRGFGSRLIIIYGGTTFRIRLKNKKNASDPKLIRIQIESRLEKGRKKCINK